MSDLDKYLKEVKARAEAATEGPWDTIKSDVKCINHQRACLEDYQFIAHARTDVPRLLEMVEYLLSKLDKESRIYRIRKRHLNEIAGVARIARGDDE